MKNIDPRLNYANMYNWTNDLPPNSINYFFSVIDYINKKNKDMVEILEIGTFAGTSAIKLTELITNSKTTVVDSWENYSEVGGVPENMDKIKENNIEQIFYNNIETSGLKDLFTVKKGDSFAVLVEFIKTNTSFDVIYVDGNHTLLTSYLDIKLSFEVLKKGGILIMDDVPFNKGDILNSPYEGVKYFLEQYAKKIKILFVDYRVFVEKL